jgi:ribonuclease-3
MLKDPLPLDAKAAANESPVQPQWSGGADLSPTAGLPHAPVPLVDDVEVRYQTLQASLGHTFSQRELLERAVTHKSYANETNGGASTVDRDNERQEFLGDAVLDLALSAILMREFPSDPEGALSKKRASLVNEETLSQIALELQLDTVIRLGRGELKTGGLAKPRILASTFEAVIGAVYSEAGFAAALAVADRLFAGRIAQVASASFDFQQDFKTRLQERLQETLKMTPSYRVETETGPDHDKQFQVSVRAGEEVLAFGVGKSKKAAEQNAAMQALEKMNEVR